MLIIFSGLPGSGKTTLARALAEQLNAVHIRIDTLEQAIRDSGMLANDIGPAGYFAAYGVVKDNLRLGRDVIADSVNALDLTRNAWHDIAQQAATNWIDIEVICSDPLEHQHRIKTRINDIGGLCQPNWQAVIEREYQPWHTPVLRIDTAGKTLPESLSELRLRLMANG